jgi:peptide/nickel transport system substrate-binding protein
MHAGRWSAILAGAALLAGLAWWTFVTNPPRALQPEGAADRARPQGDVYSVALPSAPGNLNPLTSIDGIARPLVLRYTHDPLLDLDPADGSLRPALAEAIESSRDQREHVITLRAGVAFADGSPLRLDDVLFAWEVAREPGAVLPGLADALAALERVDRLDDRRARFVLRQPTFAALSSFATRWLVGQRRFFVAAVARRAAAARVTAPQPGEPGFAALLLQVEESGPGTGPYLLQPGSVTPQGLELARNPLCWRLRAQPLCWNLDGVRYLFLADPAAQLAAARRQEVDWMYVADPAGLLAGDPELARHFRAMVYSSAREGHLMVLWNCRRRELARAEVRRALSLLVDRDALVRGVFRGNARAAAGWFVPGSGAYPAFPPDPFDPDGARRLLAAAGADGLRLRCAFDPESLVMKQTFAYLRDGFAQGGVELLEQSTPAKALPGLLESGEFDAALFIQNHMPWIDPYEDLHSSQIGVGVNYGAWANATADDLLARARVTTDAVERDGLYRRFGEVLRDDPPAALLVHPAVSAIFHVRVQDAEPGVLGLVPERWWVPPERRLWR